MNNDFLEPQITPYAKCPTCSELILIDFNKLNFQNEEINVEQTSAEDFDDSLEELKTYKVKCSHCRVEFEFEDVVENLADYYFLTSACSSAQAIKTVDIAVVIFLGSIVARLLFVFPFLHDFDEFTFILRVLFIGIAAFWFTPLLTIISWYIRYGNLQTKDEDFLAAKKSLKMSLLLWLAANCLNLLLMYTEGWIKFN